MKLAELQVQVHLAAINHMQYFVRPLEVSKAQLGQQIHRIHFISSKKLQDLTPRKS